MIRIHGSMPAEKCVELLEQKLSDFGLSLSEDIVCIWEITLLTLYAFLDHITVGNMIIKSVKSVYRDVNFLSLIELISLQFSLVPCIP